MASPYREIFSVFVFVVSVRPPPWGLPSDFGALPAGSQALPAGSEAQPTGSEALPAGSEALPAEKISLCGDAIGHCPLRGRCPKTIDEIMKSNDIKPGCCEETGITSTYETCN